MLKSFRCLQSIFMGAAALYLCAGSAAADWQYARWGATLADVQKASGGIAKINPDRSRDPTPFKANLTAPYKAGPHDFVAYFIFDQNEKLSMVDLEMRKGGDCALLAFDLAAVYGPVQDRGSFGLRKWWDRTNGNVIIYSEISNCKVRYTPIATAAKPDGL